ncbi:cyclase family protein [Aestuariibacter sp. AA17]|uniref:Cyclase family protein n=1 Tax=Fluctibacter corallii TaxID=2984329 RepID=A0ABT3AB80_9ALTE|nr:cyclase family protein [Aestuariibacter sp. AA17]MCV2885936.1 cyclase family protein [Aestuariibacter sp. AA17]
MILNRALLITWLIGIVGATSAKADDIASLASAKIVELNHVWDADAPLLGFNPPYQLVLRDTHKDSTGLIPNFSFSSDIMYFSGQHGAPNIDAIGHIGSNGKVFGGVDAVENDSAKGLKTLGIEAYPSERYLNRAVLLDVAKFKAVEHLAPGYEITENDLIQTAKHQGVKVEPGMSVLIRTGYGRFFKTDKKRYVGPIPGVGEAAAKWLAKQNVFLTGADQLTFDVYPKGGTVFPAHRILLAENGIYIVENMNLEALSDTLAQTKRYDFWLVMNPPKIRGATGMAINSFAILP